MKSVESQTIKVHSLQVGDAVSCLDTWSAKQASTPMPNKIQALKYSLTPHCLSGVCAFFGVALYYCTFVKGFATIANFYICRCLSYLHKICLVGLT